MTKVSSASEVTYGTKVAAVIDVLNNQGVDDIDINKIINIRHEKGTKFRRIHAKYN